MSRTCKKCSGRLSKAYLDRERLWRCDSCGAITPRRKPPYNNRINKAGTLLIEKSFKALGTTKKERQIRRASGTNNRDQFNKIMEMLDDLLGEGKLDLLRKVRDGQLHPITLLERYQKDEHKEDPTTLEEIGTELTDFVHTFNKWNGTTPASYQNQTKKFLEVIDGSKLVKDLPEVLETFYDICKAKGHEKKFNGLRNIVSKFLNEKLGEDHKLYKQVRAIEGFSRDRDKEAHPLEFLELKALAKKLPQPHRSIALTMALSGMGPKELWDDGFELDKEYSIRIMGKKRTGRDRRVPKVDINPYVKPTVSREGFRKALTKYSNGETTPYDLRRTFTKLLEEAGILSARISQYMGWNPKRKKLGLYTETVPEKFLKKDRQAIFLFIDKQLNPEKYIAIWKAQ